MFSIEYDNGTLLVSAKKYSYLVQNLPYCQWDNRSKCFRLPGYQYYNLISTLYYEKFSYEDKARAYQELNLTETWTKEPFYYQKEAIAKWVRAGKRGIIVLPTGTGKSFVGVMAISKASRSSIVVVPTIDLMQQWYHTLKSHFKNVNIGLIGGGYFEPADLTVITYDSAHRHLEHLGNRFGLIIFDECHHLPGGMYQLSAKFAIAPYRLGLSATPERVDGGHNILEDLIGRFVFRKNISEMSGHFLADYNVMQIKATLTKEEREEYQKHRDRYISFIRKNGIQLNKKNWHKFIIASTRSKEGRRAFQSYLKQKSIAQVTPAKLKILQRLIKKHYKERILIFTHDNATVYKISKEFLIPVITHQTKAKERREYLVGFNNGKYSILATSKVLNEGVNIPNVSIGIILSGTSSVREHVQRLGRILRKYKNKKALLYEIITQNTMEEFVSKRRRDHEAYRIN